MVAEKPDGCGSPGECFHVQVKKSAKGERIEKISDCVIVCNSFKRKISHMQVVEGFESRPHKAVSFVVEREKMQE